MYRNDFWDNKLPFNKEELIIDTNYIPKSGDVVLTRNTFIVSLFSWITHVANIYEENGDIMIFNLTTKGFEKKHWKDFVRDYDGVIMIRPLKKKLSNISKIILNENIEKQKDKSFDVMMFLSVFRKKVVSKIYKNNSSCVEAVIQILDPLRLVQDVSSHIPYDLSSRGKGLKNEYYGDEILIKG